MSEASIVSWVSSQHCSLLCVRRQDTCQSSKNTYSSAVSSPKDPLAQLPGNTTSAKDERLSSSTSYLPTYTLFYTEVDFIYLFKKSKK